MRGLERLDQRNLLAGDLQLVGVADDAEIDVRRLEPADEFAPSIEAGDEVEEIAFEKEVDFEDSFEMLDIAMVRTMAVEGVEGLSDAQKTEEFEEFVVTEWFDFETPDDQAYSLMFMSGVALEEELLDDEVFYMFAADSGEWTPEGFTPEMVQRTLSSDASDLEETWDGEYEILTLAGADDLIWATGAVDLDSPWFNSDAPLDTNMDGEMSPIDALIVSNMLSTIGPVELSFGVFEAAFSGADVDTHVAYRVDGNNDGYLSALDVLLRVNYFSSVGEQVDLPDTSNADDARMAAPASILPGEWDEYVPQDDSGASRLADFGDAFVDDSTEVFGARLRIMADDWTDYEVPEDSSKDEYWEGFDGDDVDLLLSDEVLDWLAII